MKKEIKLVPELRFGEFEGEWKEEPLSELLDFKNGLNAGKEAYGSGYKFINVLDIINNDFIVHDNIIGSVEVTEDEYNKNLVEYGDILFQRSSETREEVGQSTVYLDHEKSATFGGFVIRGKKIGDYDPAFLNYLLKTSRARKEITSKSGGSTRYNVGQKTLSEVVILTPNEDEQQKIADFLIQIDKSIQLLKDKKSRLEAYKKGVMQKLFSRELRFKDENGEEYPDWVETTLFPYLTESRIKGSNGLVAKKLTIKLYGQGVFEKIEKSSGSINTKYYKRKAGQIIYSKLDFLNCAFAIIPQHLNGLQSTLDLPSFDVSEDIDARFVLEYIKRKNFYKKYGDMADGSRKARRIHPRDFLSFPFLNPSLPEQQKIADFLTQIDRKIEKTEGQISGAEVFKKGLLQGMFV